MTPRDFCFWLKGFFELTENNERPTAKQWRMIFNTIRSTIENSFDTDGEPYDSIVMMLWGFANITGSNSVPTQEQRNKIEVSIHELFDDFDLLPRKEPKKDTKIDFDRLFEEVQKNIRKDDKTWPRPQHVPAGPRYDTPPVHSRDVINPPTQEEKVCGYHEIY